MIDIHCHIDLYSNPQHIVRQCVARKLYVLSVTTVPSAYRGTAALAPVNGRIKTALGLHPELAVARHRELGLFEQLLPETRYVGEVGLDGSREHRKSLDQQRAILGDILHMCAKVGGRTISLHSRGAIKPLLEELAKEPTAGTFILHWFVGSRLQIERAVEMGCWFSVGPSMLTSAAGAQAMMHMPLDRLLPESDGPFASLQDRQACPWDAWQIVPSLEKAWGMQTSEVEVQLMTNLRALLTIA